MSSGTCKCCGLSDAEFDHTRGTTVCVNCGAVLEDSAIVSEVQFEENAHGASTAIGQFVPSDSKGGSLHGMGSNYSGYNKDSRELTILRAKNAFTLVGNQLKISQYLIDMGLNFYKMCLSRHLTKGRRADLTYSACLYIACRIEKTPHLLIDFCEILQLDVFTLARTSSYLAKELCLNLPYLDPCVYLLRYANKLNFGDKTHQVYMTSLRILKRMKRDNLHHGRVPGGLCGAALLIAGRCYGFSRTLNDVVTVVRIHESTLRKRLVEFGRTPSSNLTIDEFLTVDLGEEQDPPSYKAAQIKDYQKNKKIVDPDYEKKIKQMERTIEKHLKRFQQMKNLATGRLGEECNDSEELDNPAALDWLDIDPLPDENKSKLDGKSQSRESDTDDDDMAKELDYDILKDVLNINAPEIDNEIIFKSTIGSIRNSVNKSTSDDLFSSTDTESVSSLETDDEEVVAEIEKVVKEDNQNPETEEWGPKKEPSLAALGLYGDDSSTEQSEQSEQVKFSMDDIDDSQLDCYFTSEKEAEVKLKTWTSMYGEYMEEMKRKRDLREAEEEENVTKRKKRKPKSKIGTNYSSATEAVEQVLKVKKVSKKINYEVLKSLNTTESAMSGQFDLLNDDSDIIGSKSSFPPAAEEKSSLKKSPVVSSDEDTELSDDTSDTDEDEKSPVRRPVDEDNVSISELLRRESEVNNYVDDDDDTYY